MPVLRLFASAREAAGVARAELEGTTVDELLSAASALYGERFAAVLTRSRIWVNGEPATGDTPVTGHDVVAVLPPVSGGAGDTMVVEPRAPVAQEAPAPPAPPAPVSAALPVAAPPAPPAPGARPPASSAPVPASAPLPVAAPSPAPASAPRAGPPASPSTPPSAPAAPPRPAAPMAGLGGARAPSPPAVAPRDPPVPPPPPVPLVPEPAAPRPGEIGGAAISPPLAADGASGAPAAAPESPLATPPAEHRPAVEPDEKRPEDERLEEDRGGGWSLARFAVVYDVNRAHGRIGLAWAAVTVAAVLAGKAWVAAWLGLAAFVGASQTAAARRALDERPPPWLAAVAAVGPPVAALYSGMHLVGAVGAGLGAALLARTFVPDGSVARDLSIALLIGVATGTAAGSVVVTRALGINPTLFLLACAAVYDMGAYLIGTGAGADWEGPVAGMVGIMPVTILASVLLVPPFPGGGPLLLGALAVVLAPLGPLVATALVGDRRFDAPGLRRLDSLILLAPVWAWAATRLLG